MKSPIALSAVALLLASASPAFPQAEPAGGGEPEIDIEARKRSVVNLEAHIADRRERMKEVAQSIIDLDARVEKGIDKIVTRLKEVADSKDSQVRVATTKEKAIQGLRRTIEYYVRKRDELKEQLRKGGGAIPRETLEGDVEVFDERIEKRVGQIIGLAKSFTEYEELDKYETDTHSSWGWSWTERRISGDWRLNNKQVRHTEAQRKEIAEGLNRSIERLERENKDLAERVKSPTLSEEGREFYKQEIAGNESQISMRRAQLESLFTLAGDSGGGTKISRSEAHSMQRAIDDMAKDLREDFFSIFENYAELNRLRGQIAELEENLQARRDWLEAYEKERG